MQLKRQPCCSLAAAAVALLGGAPAAAQAQPLLGSGWTFDTATLFYAEGNGRVKAFEPKLNITKDLGDDRNVLFSGTIDVVSGATPNGAAPAAQPQTFSKPSGSSGGYTVAPYQLPKDPTFEDQREAAQLGYSFRIGSTDHFNVSASVSTEHDYFSLGAGTGWAHDLNGGNTTLGAALSYSDDTVSPIGGAPMPLSRLAAPASGGDGGGEGEGGGTSVGPAHKGKQVVEAMVGVTQLISPESLMQLNYSLDRESGYLNDPYKILSVVDPSANPLYYVYEERPGHRLRQTAYFQFKQAVRTSDVADLSYRFMTDNWGIRSHTADLSYRWRFTSMQYLEPHLRWYRQNQASFYHAALDQGQETQLSSASADPRLGAFDAYTGGLKYGDTLRNGWSWSIRLEYYSQRGRVTGLPPAAGAALSQFNLAPSLTATWAILGFSF